MRLRASVSKRGSFFIAWTTVLLLGASFAEAHVFLTGNPYSGIEDWGLEKRAAVSAATLQPSAKSTTKKGSRAASTKAGGRADAGTTTTLGESWTEPFSGGRAAGVLGPLVDICVAGGCGLCGGKTTGETLTAPLLDWCLGADCLACAGSDETVFRVAMGSSCLTGGLWLTVAQRFFRKATQNRFSSKTNKAVGAGNGGKKRTTTPGRPRGGGSNGGRRSVALPVGAGGVPAVALTRENVVVDAVACQKGTLQVLQDTGFVIERVCRECHRGTRSVAQLNIRCIGTEMHSAFLSRGRIL